MVRMLAMVNEIKIDKVKVGQQAGSETRQKIAAIHPMILRPDAFG
jgi:hypothetical protein